VDLYKYMPIGRYLPHQHGLNIFHICTNVSQHPNKQQASGLQTCSIKTKTHTALAHKTAALSHVKNLRTQTDTQSCSHTYTPLPRPQLPVASPPQLEPARTPLQLVLRHVPHAGVPPLACTTLKHPLALMCMQHDHKALGTERASRILARTWPQAPTLTRVWLQAPHSGVYGHKHLHSHTCALTSNPQYLWPASSASRRCAMRASISCCAGVGPCCCCCEDSRRSARAARACSVSWARSSSRASWV